MEGDASESILDALNLGVDLDGDHSPMNSEEYDETMKAYEAEFELEYARAQASEATEKQVLVTTQRTDFGAAVRADKTGTGEDKGKDDVVDDEPNARPPPPPAPQQPPPAPQQQPQLMMRPPPQPQPTRQQQECDLQAGTSGRPDGQQPPPPRPETSSRAADPFVTPADKVF